MSSVFSKPKGFNFMEAEGRAAFTAGYPCEHPYGETLGGREWVSGWKAQEKAAA